MKKPKNELMMFAAGLVMLVAGLFILSQKVIVYSGFFGGGGFRFGGFNVSAGLVMVPFIIGIVWMFMTDSFASKVFTALAVLLIVIAIIMSTNFHLKSMTMFDWVVILVLIFGGLGFIGRVVLANPEKRKSKKEQYKELRDRMDELDIDLENFKN